MQATPTTGMHSTSRGIPVPYVHPSGPLSRSTLPVRPQDGWGPQLMSSAPPLHAAMQAAPAEAHGRSQDKPHRRSIQDVIPIDQMHRSRVGRPVQLDRIRREQAHEATSASGSRSEERHPLSQMEKSRIRSKGHRDDLDTAFSGLFTETYGPEDESPRENHTKSECVRDAARLIRTLKRENAALRETVRRLEQRKDRRPWEI